MDRTAALLALAGGTIPNASWNGLKALAGQLTKNRAGLDPEEIFSKTPLDSLSQYERRSGVAEFADTVKYRLRTDRVSRAFDQVRIDDIGAVASSIDVDGIARQVSRKLVDQPIPDLRNDDAIQVKTQVIDGGILRFRSSPARSWRGVAILAESLKLDPVLNCRDDMTKAQKLVGKLEATQFGIVDLKATIDRESATWGNLGSQSVADRTDRQCPSRTITDYAELLQIVDILAYLRDVTVRYEFGLPHQKGIYVKPQVALAGQSDPEVGFDVQDFNADRDSCWLILSDLRTGNTAFLENLADPLTRNVLASNAGNVLLWACATAINLQ